MVVTKERFYRVRQLAEIWDVSERHIWNLVYSGRLACVRLGQDAKRVVRIEQSAVDAYLAACRSGGDSADSDAANTD